METYFNNDNKLIKLYTNTPLALTRDQVSLDEWSDFPHTSIEFIIHGHIYLSKWFTVPRDLTIYDIEKLENKAQRDYKYVLRRKPLTSMKVMNEKGELITYVDFTEELRAKIKAKPFRHYWNANIFFGRY
jgi:hypothetical protein